MDTSLLITNLPSPQVAVLALNRPEKRNALNIALIEAIRGGLRRLEGEAAVRVVIVRGEGPAFCAGLDLQEAGDAGRSGESAEALAGLYLELCKSDLVSIAAVHGAVIGGGLGLAAACDLAVASEDVRIVCPEASRGLVAALVEALLAGQILPRHLRELTLLGEALDAHRALEVGLVNRVVATPRLTDECLKLAAQVCRGAPGAIARTKRLLRELSARPIEEEIAIALRYHLQARNSSEAAEGIAAFREKRQPRWGPRNP
ncbi:MAG TPA: enoyl-CoA hydratase-related protein [Tepidisphaeraceae bacterium]|jgi:methylglutaconyl-CoA hydratase